MPALTHTALAAAVLLAVGLAACRSESAIDPAIADSLPATIDYNFHVKPILSDRCYACHGPDEGQRKADLRLDIEEAATAKRESGGRAIVPGRPDKSLLVERIASHDPGFVMPPPESNLQLDDYERAVLTRWVEQGAKFKPHWAYIAPTRATSGSAWASVSESAPESAPIDSFIVDRLERSSLIPTSEADKETIIRRLSFDLTGLPPSIEEIDNFLADDSPDAYERVVDRLLASPAYGERMAVDWLDLARYADSHGYQDDGLRNMWPWRDWVIKAFNRNMPYDEFVKVQLAGDLLPNHTRDQILATGFNRNHLQSQEGGIVPEEYRVDYVADRTNTLGRALLGLTVECSRCHDHKFDPITQKEYFELFAFFNSVNEFGNIPYAGEASPTVILTSAEADAALSRLGRQIDSLEVLVEPAHDRFDEPYSRWLAVLEDGVDSGDGGVKPALDLSAGRIAYYPLDDEPGRMVAGEVDRSIVNVADRSHDGYVWGDVDKQPIVVEGKVGTALKLVGDPWIDMGKDVAWFERNEPFSVALWLNIADDEREGPIFNKSGGYFNGRRGYVAMLNRDGTLSASLNHVFPANSIEVETLEPLPKRRWMHLAMTYDGSSRASGIALYLDGEPLPTRVKADNLKMSILYQVDPRTGARSNWGDPGNLRLGWTESNAAMLDSVVVDELMVYDRRLTSLEVRGLVAAAETARATASAVADEAGIASDAALREFYVLNRDPDYRRDFDKLTTLRGEENEILTRQPEVMVMGDLDEPRPTFVLDRGAYDAPTERVSPSTPSFILAFNESLPEDRRGLAEWLFDPRHPLTARVAVNRMWQRFFGRGIVATPDDFGSQGARPTHPELLDWLALEFIEGGWDMKAMQKLIVSSDAYRRSSTADVRSLEIDPDNELLARGPMFRLSAEQLRDNALAASGLLNRAIGGEPVKPYQPVGLWEELATRNATSYEQDTGDKLYRRSMYTIWKRTTPPPSMVTFDVADRNMCTVRRETTNTPLQALVLLNDPQFVEAARVLAERVIADESDVEGRITRMFRSLTSRHPQADEINVLTDLVAEQREAFAEEPGRASRLLAVGEWPRDRRLNPVEAASYAVAASTIMNFDEVVIRR